MKTTPAPWPLWLCNVRRGRQSSALIILACHGVTVHFLVTPPPPVSPASAGDALHGFSRNGFPPSKESQEECSRCSSAVAMSLNVSLIILDPLYSTHDHVTGRDFRLRSEQFFSD